MLIIRRNQTNNLICTASMNRTLSNPYYLLSFLHIASKERVSFLPEVVSSNTRYDKFRFVESTTTDLSLVPPQVNFLYNGQWYYSIYEQLSPTNTDINLTYNKLESGRAIVIVGDDQEDECFYEPYISQNEDNNNIIFLSEQEEQCNQAITPSITPSNTPTPSITPSITPTMTKTPTQTPSATPTYTPTPSTTPPAVITPNTLNAIWWLDYSSSNYLTLNGANINGATNRTGNPDFTGFSASYPQWSSTGYNGVSGATIFGGVGLSSLSGDYSSISAYTHFFHFYYLPEPSQGQGLLIESESGMIDYSGNTQSYRWFSTSDYTTFPQDFIRHYTFYTNATSTNPEPNFFPTGGTWYKAAVRVYQTTNTAHTELYINDVLVSSTNQNGVTIITADSPIFRAINGVSDVYLTEQFFFDYKLNDTQLSQMFQYLNNKYV